MQKRLSLREETYAGCALISNQPQEQQNPNQHYSQKSLNSNAMYEVPRRFGQELQQPFGANNPQMSNYNTYNYQSQKNVSVTSVNLQNINKKTTNQNESEGVQYNENPNRRLSLQQPQQLTQQIYFNHKDYYAGKVPSFFEARTTTSISSSSYAQLGFQQECEAVKRQEYMQQLERGQNSKRGSLDSLVYLKTETQFDGPFQNNQKGLRLLSDYEVSTVSTSNSSNDNSDAQSDESAKVKNTEIEKQYERIRIEDSATPARVAAYSREIFQHLQMKEKQLLINENYMQEQTEISELNRWALIDWLIEVQLKFKLQQETLFIAIYIIDRYLSLVKIRKNELQLVGVTAIFIAAKYEEIYPPELNELSEITNKNCSKKDIITIEGQIINALNFQITVPSSYRFAEWYCRLSEFTPKETCQAFYFVEMAMLDSRFLKYSPSNIAASAILLVNKINKQENCWPDLLEYDSGYSELKIRQCAKDFIYQQQKFQTMPKKPAVYQKYSSPKFHKVGSINLGVCKDNQN